MNNTNVKIVAISETIHHNGLIPMRIVLWEQKDGKFTTHIECIPRKHPKFEQGNSDYDMNPYFVHGHYDQKLRSALIDFANRVADLKERS